MSLLLNRYLNLPKGLMLASVLLFLFQSFFIKPILQNRSDYLPPPAIIKDMSLGFKVQLSDSFWLRAIQDFDYCSEPLSEKECSGKSWLFEILDLTTELDTVFMHAYIWGGLALTVIISDYAGASIIFDKGVKQFPNEWKLNYAAGYHALFEEKDKLKASKLYLSAANNGAPSWVRLMAGRLAIESGARDFATEIIDTMIKLSDDPRYIKRLKKKMDEFKK